MASGQWPRQFTAQPWTKSRYAFPLWSRIHDPRPSTNTTGGRLVISIRAPNESCVPSMPGLACDRIISFSCNVPEETEAKMHKGPRRCRRGPLWFILKISSADPHIPHPRRKAARTYGDAAGEVRIIHDETDAGSGPKCQ